MTGGAPERTIADFQAEIGLAWNNLRQVREKYGGAGLTSYLKSRTEKTLKIALGQVSRGERPNDRALGRASQELGLAAMDPLQYIGTRIDQAVLASREVDTSQAPDFGGHTRTEATYRFKSDPRVITEATEEYKRCRQIQSGLMKNILAGETQRLAGLPVQNRRVVEFLVTHVSNQVDRADPKRESPYTNPFNDANNTEYGYTARAAAGGLHRLAGIQDETGLLAALTEETNRRRAEMSVATRIWEKKGKPPSGDSYNQYYLSAQAVREAVGINKTVKNPAPHTKVRPAGRLN